LTFSNRGYKAASPNVAFGRPVHFLEVMIGFSETTERGSQDLSNRTNVASEFANIFFSVLSSIVYGPMLQAPSSLASSFPWVISRLHRVPSPIH
jgi:hypothetical protein